MTITKPWDGRSEEGALRRRDHKYPWVYVIQVADPEAPAPPYHWGVYSQGARAHEAFALGVEPSLAGAREAAADAARGLT